MIDLYVACGERLSVRKLLHTEEKLTFTKAIDLAQTLMTASKDAQLKQNKFPVETVLCC